MFMLDYSTVAHVPVCVCVCESVDLLYQAGSQAHVAVHQKLLHPQLELLRCQAAVLRVRTSTCPEHLKMRSRVSRISTKQQQGIHHLFEGWKMPQMLFSPTLAAHASRIPRSIRRCKLCEVLGYPHLKHTHECVLTCGARH